MKNAVYLIAGLALILIGGYMSFWAEDIGWTPSNRAEIAGVTLIIWGIAGVLCGLVNRADARSY